jgi:large subunit ribosomal protein L27Ae
MRHFHLTRNKYWRPVINVDKLWSLVPEEEKKGLTETSEVVPVIDTLQNGYGKVLGNGKYVSRGHARFPDAADSYTPRLPKLPFIVKARFVSAKAE